MTAGFLAAQAPPVFHVNVTSRTTKAINYRHRSGATKIDFQGTSLLPAAHGEAKVESKQGYIEIEVEFRNLQTATQNGAEYLTYVMWAVTPEGRTANLGEVLLNGTSSKLDVTTELQVFALIVTAEPYFAVSQPSDLIVMENVVRADTKGKIEEVDAKYELLQRGQYEKLANPLALKADKRLPLELYEARNAVSIARSIGANRVASETYSKAEKSLAQAEEYQKRNAGRKSVAMASREAVQMAEDSRVITVKRQADDALAAERQQSADRALRAENGRATAESETNRIRRSAEDARMIAEADSARMAREREAQAATSASEADRVRRDSDARAAAAQAEAERLRQQNDARMAAAKAENDSRFAVASNEADRLKAENKRAVAARKESDERLASASADADKLKQQNEARMAASKAENDLRFAAAATEAGRLKSENDARAIAARKESDERLASAGSDAEKLRQQNEARTAFAKAESDSRLAAASTEANRLKLENDARSTAAKSESDSRLASAGAESDRLKRENEAQRESAQAELEKSAAQRAQLEKEKADLRTELLAQFNLILQTRDTARGLIVNMSDVLFDTGKFSLRPIAREKLAKVAGIISGHPGLRLDVEGHTDSVGGDEYNQELSEHRGESVRDYLTHQGMASASVTTKGFGKTQPVATNETAEGRQQNRRVELVISGDVIGKEIGKIAAVR